MDCSSLDGNGGGGGLGGGGPAGVALEKGAEAESGTAPVVGALIELSELFLFGVVLGTQTWDYFFKLPKQFFRT